MEELAFHWLLTSPIISFKILNGLQIVENNIAALRILILEDTPTDAELMTHELR
jgi:hypothetical protein